MNWLERMIQDRVDAVLFRAVTSVVTQKIPSIAYELAKDESFCKQVAACIDAEDVADEMDASAIAKKLDCEALAIRVSQNFRFQQETCRQLDYAQFGKAVIASIKASS